MLSLERKKVSVAAIGKLDAATAANAIGVANACQHSFRFSDLYEMPFKLKPYRLANGGYDLDEAAPSFIKKSGLKGFVMLLSSHPYGGKSTADQDGDYFFSGELDGGVGIISTHLWSKVSPASPLQDYIIFMLGASLLSALGGLHYHDETRGCIMDYCAKPEDFLKSFTTGGVCPACHEQCGRAIAAGQMSRAQFAACIRLINRGRRVRNCFVVMPFRKELTQVYRKAVRPALESTGHEVKRGDEIVWPRIITDAIVSEILAADLIVADITGSNPNVFYEIGVADAIGVDIVMLCQQGEPIPFDISHRRTIFYKADQLDKLAKDLSGLTGYPSAKGLV